MSRALRNTVLALCCAAPFAVAAHLWAGDEHPKKTEQAAGKAEQTKAKSEHPTGEMSSAKPGAMHAHLQKAIGKWKYTNTMKMDPNGPPMTVQGTEETTSLCGGLFIHSKNMSAGAMPFEGYGIEGYDVHKKKYVGSWVDNWGTAVYTYEGTCNPEGTVFTYTMTGPNPQTGEPMTMCMVTEYKGANSRTFKMWQGPKPEGNPTMVIEYTKADVVDRR